MYIQDEKIKGEGGEVLGRKRGGEKELINSSLP
jgi:hypothetical protein